MALTAPPDAPERAAQLARAAELWGAVLATHRPYTPPWFDTKWWHLETLRRQGRDALVRDLLRNLDVVAPGLGGEAMRARFEPLGRAVGLPAGWARGRDQ